MQPKHNAQLVPLAKQLRRHMTKPGVCAYIDAAVKQSLSQPDGCQLPLHKGAEDAGRTPVHCPHSFPFPRERRAAERI